jgi:septal ring factor EnvC (AmiA/AmiB activator)
MSDALTAAGMICNTMHAYQIGDMFTAARARNNEAAEIAALQALVQRLANYGRYVEQQHNSLLAEAKKIDAQRCQQINAQLDEIAELRRELENKGEVTASLLRQIGRMREELATLTYRKIDYMAKADELERHVAALEDENAKLRKASSSD